MRLLGHTLKREARNGFQKHGWNCHSLTGNGWRFKPAHRWVSAYSAISGTPAQILYYKGMLVIAVGGSIYINGTAVATYTGTVYITGLDTRIIWYDSAQSYIRAYDTAQPGWGTTDLGVLAPVAPVLTPVASAGGDLESGKYWYGIAWIDAYGCESQVTGWFGVTTSAGDKVTLSVLPTAPHAKYTKLRIYRTAVQAATATAPDVLYELADVTMPAGSYVDTAGDDDLRAPLRMEGWPDSYRLMPAGGPAKVWGDRLVWYSGSKVYISSIGDFGEAKYGEAYTYRDVGDGSAITAAVVLGTDLYVFKADGIYPISQYEPWLVGETIPLGTPGEHTVTASGRLYFWHRGKLYWIVASQYGIVSGEYEPIASEIHKGATGSWIPTRVCSDNHGNIWVIGPCDTPDTFDLATTGSVFWAAYVVSFEAGTCYRFVNCDFLGGMAVNTTVSTTYALDSNGRLQLLDWSATGEQLAAVDVQYITSFTIVSLVRITLGVPNAAFIAGTWLWVYDSTRKRITLTRVKAQHGLNDIEVEAAVFHDTTTALVMGYSYFHKDEELLPGPEFKDLTIGHYHIWAQALSAGKVSVTTGLKDVELQAAASLAPLTVGWADHYKKAVDKRFLGGALYFAGVVTGCPVVQLDAVHSTGGTGGRA